MKLIPRNAVVVNWHYGAEATFEPYIQTIAARRLRADGRAGRQQLERDLSERRVPRSANERRFIDEGKAARVLGLFQTVWHDDGETLYEATWYPVLYAAAAAWQDGDVAAGRVRRAIFRARSSASTIRATRATSTSSAPCSRSSNRRTTRYGQTDALFWADPFDPARSGPGCRTSTCGGCACEPKRSNTISTSNAPPLHANAAFVMFLAARRYDALGAKVPNRIARCARCTPMRSRTPPTRSRRRRCAICSGAATGCGSCATRTSISRRSTRAPGATRAATGHLREQSRALSSRRADGDRAGRRVLPRRRDDAYANARSRCRSRRADA